jgi:hypothetical protein
LSYKDNTLKFSKLENVRGSRLFKSFLFNDKFCKLVSDSKESASIDVKWLKFNFNVILFVPSLIVRINVVKNPNHLNIRQKHQRIMEKDKISIIIQTTKKNCLGKDNCQNCVLSENQNCVRCVESLWNEQYFPLNGTQTIICDQVNNLHQTTCNFYCRMKESQTWKCEQIEGYPLCNCITEKITTTTLTSSTATTTTTTTTKQPLGSLIG